MTAFLWPGCHHFVAHRHLGTVCELTLRRSHRQVVKALGVSIGKISGALARYPFGRGRSLRNGYLARAAAIGLDADGIERLTDAELEAALYPKAVAASARTVPDCAALHLELRRPKVTLALLLVEFIEGHADWSCSA